MCHIEDLNGHRKVIEAVDAFSMSKGETHRFQTLVYHFYDNSCTMEFRVSVTFQSNLIVSLFGMFLLAVVSGIHLLSL